MLFRCLFAVMATFLAISAPSLAAGTDLSRYYGMWIVQQGGMAGKCQVELTGQSFDGRLSGRSILCLRPLAFMNGWAPSGRGVTLLGMDGRPIITLESARGILVGRLPDGSMISMFPAGGQQMPQSRTTSDDQGTCYRRADTGRCADAPDIAPPRGQKAVGVRAIGPLNVRRDEDMKSPVIATIKAGQCFALEACRDTQWGVRCRIPVDRNGNKGYVVKYYSKAGRDFIAFLNRC